jgi:glycosyltransferase involved in cell wall biosynthesis
MTIGFLLNTCEPFYRGGYERRAWSFARELARQGHDVRIYTSCPRDETIEGVRFVRLAAPRRFFNDRGVRNGGADLLFAVAVLRLLVRLRRGELDVLDVCATPFVHLPSAALVAWWKRIPAVLTCHEALLVALPAYVRERGEVQHWRAGVTTRVLAFIYRMGMALFPRRIAVSVRTAAALEHEGFPARHTVEFGLEPDAIAEAPPSPHPAGEPVRAIYCGRLTPIKNVDQILAALLPLRTEPHRFHLDIVGDGSERARLEAMVAAAGAREIVTFHGEVPEPRKRELLAAADIFLLASPREGFSIATLEAMAQGCAALVVNDPARPNGVLDFARDGEGGRVVAPGAESMRDGFVHLLEHHRERERLRRGAWEIARRYRIDAQAARLLAAYVAEKNRPAL